MPPFAAANAAEYEDHPDMAELRRKSQEEYRLLSEKIKAEKAAAQKAIEDNGLEAFSQDCQKMNKTSAAPAAGAPRRASSHGPGTARTPSAAPPLHSQVKLSV